MASADSLNDDLDPERTKRRLTTQRRRAIKGITDSDNFFVVIIDEEEQRTEIIQAMEIGMLPHLLDAFNTSMLTNVKNVATAALDARGTQFSDLDEDEPISKEDLADFLKQLQDLPTTGEPKTEKPGHRFRWHER